MTLRGLVIDHAYMAKWYGRSVNRSMRALADPRHTTETVKVLRAMLREDTSRALFHAAKELARLGGAS